MKLVRDKIPELHAAGLLGPHPLGSAHRESQTFRQATPEEYRLLLRTKLAEEVGEVLAAVRHDHLMEEIGDVIDVLQAIADLEGLTDHDRARRRIKMDKFGGFAEGWILEVKE